MATASEIVGKLNLKPHPEGGFYSETFRDYSVHLSKSHLPPEYKVDREVLELNEKDGRVKLTCLGSDLIGDNQLPQYTVPPNVWFGAFPTKDFNISADGTLTKAAPRDSENHYSLVGCSCAPAFQFEDFELAKRSDLVSRFPDSEAFVSLLTPDA
ncbi:uncharacterized protein LOC101210771 isoform X2 [Cucumis sativus]|uniref:uncharacterized protein LOC101210771 isoform X2 n=1 Tax=Cucumis sativus TaxID=3659 RepID=UPI0002B4B18D|nr:uncharacterized protein LOC101210771 isoform X2 [Cucumis sativus]